MPAFLLPLLLRAVPVLLGGLALWYGWHRVDYWCNAACKENAENYARAEQHAKELAAQIAAAEKRATDLALLWAQQVDKTEEKNREADAERRKVFDALADRSRRLPGVPSVRLSVDADRVWRDASREANAARPAPEREAPADPVPQPTYSEADLAAFFVESARAYADAYGQWQACVNHYESLREQQ